MKTITARKKKRRIGGISLIIPAAILLLVTFAAPLAYALLISFSDSQSVISNEIDLAGFKNYISVLQNSRFQSALIHTCLFVVTTIVTEFVLGFIIALLLYREPKGSRVFKLIFAVPLMVAPVVSGLQWRWLFADQYGIINHLLNLAGIEPPLWFSGTMTAWLTVLISNLWLATPFVILVLLSGLCGLSGELNEAAAIDGANSRQIFFKIMLPQLKPTILIILVIRLTDAFRIYDLVYILTGGGPGGATEVLSTFVYKRTFTDWRFGEGSAASFVIMLLICAVSLVCNKVMTERE